jgi:putative ABC transport system substrate-binding protein
VILKARFRRQRRSGPRPHRRRVPDFGAAPTAERIGDFAAKNRLILVGTPKWLSEAGALLTYGPNPADLFRRAASYVDKIFKGAKPAELPMEQPTKYELVVNLKTAKSLGLAVPPTLIARADEVIE